MAQTNGIVRMEIAYQGELRCQATHGPSGQMICTDAPVDNNGKGESFSPTDLVATALGACMLTIMGIVAERNQVDLSGSNVVVTKEMTKTGIRRIERLGVTITIPHDIPQGVQMALTSAAEVCPVFKSLNPEIDVNITFFWGK
ncbi:MAG: OsmC family protein [bacterium]|jgi:putative redox protein